MDPRFGGTVIISMAQSLVPTRFGILVGETIYNLRAALDYLVDELAILGSGQIQQGTQFPIEESEQGWRRRMNGRRRGEVSDDGCYLRGLSRRHKACIKLLQPYYGCDWMRVLRVIANPDKHRTLTIIKPTQILSVEPNSEGPVLLNPSIEGETTLFRVRFTSPGETVEMNADVSFEIAFDDGGPVIGTLQELHRNVNDVLGVFNLDFQT